MKTDWMSEWMIVSQLVSSTASVNAVKLLITMLRDIKNKLVVKLKI
jgi:hypothetical protein